MYSLFLGTLVRPAHIISIIACCIIFNGLLMYAKNCTCHMLYVECCLPIAKAFFCRFAWRLEQVCMHHDYACTVLQQYTGNQVGAASCHQHDVGFKVKDETHATANHVASAYMGVKTVMWMETSQKTDRLGSNSAQDCLHQLLFCRRLSVNFVELPRMQSHNWCLLSC